MSKKLVNQKSISKGDIEQSFLSQSLNTDFIILFCVSNSTIRAFHKYNAYITYTPTSIFQSWLSSILHRDLKKAISKGIKEKEGFVNFKIAYLNKLVTYWKKKSGCDYELKYYQKNKLIDLFFKFLILWNELNNHQKQWLFRNVNVPLDSLILKELRKHKISEVKKLKIPNKESLSMNWVKETNYYEIQRAIATILVNKNPILFDLIVWHHNRNILRKPNEE